MEINNILCVSINNGPYKEVIEIIKKYDFVELCIDKLNYNIYELVELISFTKKVIISCNNIISTNPDRDRLFKLMEVVNCGANIFDIPISSVNFKAKFIELIDKIKIIKKQIIISYHQYEPLVNIQKIQDEINKMMLFKADFYKIAVKCNSINDTNILFSLYEKNKELNGKLIIIPMISKYPFARIRALELGAPFMYCYDNYPTAEGQMSYKEMKTTLKNINNNK